MKKETKKIILSSLITGIICTGIGVSAATYFSADQIKFTPTDVNWKVDNAQDAMNSLFYNTVDGKALIANALTAKGLSTPTDSSYETLANNIASIDYISEGDYETIINILSNEAGTTIPVTATPEEANAIFLDSLYPTRNLGSVSKEMGQFAGTSGTFYTMKKGAYTKVTGSVSFETTSYGADKGNVEVWVTVSNGTQSKRGGISQKSGSASGSFTIDISDFTYANDITVSYSFTNPNTWGYKFSINNVTISR